MNSMTLALSLLLGIGFVVAKIAQFFRSPSVTGYICAGVLFGSCGLAIITCSVRCGDGNPCAIWSRSYPAVGRHQISLF